MEPSGFAGFGELWDLGWLSQFLTAFTGIVLWYRVWYFSPRAAFLYLRDPSETQVVFRDILRVEQPLREFNTPQPTLNPKAEALSPVRHTPCPQNPRITVGALKEKIRGLRIRGFRQRDPHLT